MTPATAAKAAAIQAALENEDRRTTYNRAYLAEMLALLTSQNKAERELAKDTVRGLAYVGKQLLANLESDTRSARDPVSPLRPHSET